MQEISYGVLCLATGKKFVCSKCGRRCLDGLDGKFRLLLCFDCV